MKSSVLKINIIILTIIIVSAWSAGATDLVFSLPEISVNSYYNAEGKPAGYFVEMYTLFSKNYKNGNLTLKGLFPFKRSLNNVILGKADIHYPMIRPPDFNLRQLPYDFLPVRIGTVHFVLYTKADDRRLINKNNIANFLIEVKSGHSEYFGFKTVAGNSSEQILKKLLKGRIDGYIDAQDVADKVIRKHKYRNLKRQFFENFDMGFVIPKGEKGQRVNEAFVKFIKDIIRSPEFIKINANIDQPYINWQPYNTDWH